MGQANGSFTATQGAGTTFAEHTQNSKKHSVPILAHANGHLLTDLPLFFFHVPSSVHVAAASTLFLDVWNGDASKIARVLTIQPIVNLETAVTGIGFEWQLLRTTAIGTGGSGITAWAADTNDAVDADISCRSKPTGGATASTALRTIFTHSEETQAGNQFAGGGYGDLDLVPRVLRDNLKGIVLRPSQGLRINQETNSNAGNTGWLIGYMLEG